MGERVQNRLPVFIGAVVLMPFLLLTLLFLSILVPIKAAILNLLSIGVAYGVLVMVFQWGWGKSLIGLESTGRAGVGLRAAGLPRAIWAALRLLTRRISYPETARQIELTTGRGTAMAYQGFGLRL